MFPTYGLAVIFQRPHAATGLPSWDCGCGFLSPEVGIGPRQSHRLHTSQGLTLAFMLCCCHLKILNRF